MKIGPNVESAIAAVVAFVSPGSEQEARRAIDGLINALGRRSSVCPKGHERNTENTIINNRGHRECRVCKNERDRAKWAERYGRLRANASRRERRRQCQRAAWARRYPRIAEKRRKAARIRNAAKKYPSMPPEDRHLFTEALYWVKRELRNELLKNNQDQSNDLRNHRPVDGEQGR